MKNYLTTTEEDMEQWRRESPRRADLVLMMLKTDLGLNLADPEELNDAE